MGGKNTEGGVMEGKGKKRGKHGESRVSRGQIEEEYE